MFIDTSGWLCVIDARDRRHRDARRYFESANKLITHNYVLAELVPLAMKRGFSRVRTLQFIDEIIDDPTIKVVWLTEGQTRQANDLLKSRTDKMWSLCDAASFLIMDQAGFTEALTTDHHFEQAGFIKLLES